MTDHNPQKNIDRLLQKVAAQNPQQKEEQKPSKAQVRKAMRLIERVLTERETIKQQQTEDPVTPWEDEFLTGVKSRVRRYGAAFFDPLKGDKSKALSYLQNDKLRQIKKSVAKKNNARRS